MIRLRNNVLASDCKTSEAMFYYHNDGKQYVAVISVRVPFVFSSPEFILSVVKRTTWVYIRHTCNKQSEKYKLQSSREGEIQQISCRLCDYDVREAKTLNKWITQTSFARHKLKITFCAIIHFIRFPQFKRVGRIFQVFRVFILVDF